MEVSVMKSDHGDHQMALNGEE
ncbi:uncharacterized protein G2W53_027472 [Senna tora]|uniref:Uncharacterized protein n=1 Tax=Senna tora TaxID=362788 RepID=A0A834TIR9_9FABA|nr:uncharacterized protein G2W53_027472 [Senna tora]